jgi:hypothetical protein
VQKKLRLMTTNPQLDALFEEISSDKLTGRARAMPIEALALPLMGIALALPILPVFRSNWDVVPRVD